MATESCGRKGPEVVLVAMPWATALQPSIQLGILTARLAAAGISASGFYANLPFAKDVGLTRYERYGTFDSLFSQWIFSECLFDSFTPPDSVGPRDFPDFAAEAGVSQEQIAELRRVKELVPAFISWCLSAYDWERVKLVGFTTTLLQTLPSLALGRRLKEAFPHLRVVLGGAGCSGVMGKAILRNFAFVDGVIDGEADLTIAPLARAVIDGRDPEGLAGLSWRGLPPATAMGKLPDLGDYPPPAYRDYFEQAREVFGGQPSHATRVPFEASRGCWWALKAQCKFCGLNGEALAQRAREVDAVLDELVSFREEHGATFFFATDNIIAPTHVTHLPRALKERLPGAELFFEARVVMQRSHLRGLADAGVVHIQAGVESLIRQVLSMTDKGTTPADNLCFLRRCVEFGIKPYWNLLHGFPGEERSWYDALLAALPAFYHLPVPDIIRFSLQRFSPYFDEPERHGIRVLGPFPGSLYVWNLPVEEIRDLCFDLAFELPQRWDVSALTEELQATTSAWAAAGAELSAELSPDGTTSIVDTRPAFGGRYAVPEAPGLALRALEKPSTLPELGERLRRAGLPQSAASLAAHLDWLADRGLIFRDSGDHVALVVPRSEGFWLSADDAPRTRRLPLTNIFRPSVG
jgi:magnesium-protoporphyrin IX monomethyl ester (oxidative) cyclase